MKPECGNKNQKILIVDDIAENIRILNEMLQDEGVIHFATTGAEALRLAVETNPDLILLDVMMPDMDGYEVLRKMNEDAVLQSIPVIFITALDQAEDEEKGLGLGAVDYIAKPFRPGIVKLRVRNHLELKRQRDFFNCLSTLDGLTGIANRRAFDDTLLREWRRAARSRKNLSLLMLDIDHFKNFNDHYGHLKGDECLKDIAKTIAGTSRTMMLMLMSIASISLLVGGIGIMNILLVSVTERTREIGLRMAVGAKRRHILLQFLIEAIIMTVIGGVLGVAAGIGGARLLTTMVGWPTIISSQAVVMAFLFSVAVGIFFGLYPANKASKLNPIEALHYE